MKDAVLGFCGIKHIKRMMYAGVKQSSVQGRQKWLNYLYQQALHL